MRPPSALRRGSRPLMPALATAALLAALAPAASATTVASGTGINLDTLRSDDIAVVDVRAIAELPTARGNLARLLDLAPPPLRPANEIAEYGTSFLLDGRTAHSATYDSVLAIARLPVEPAIGVGAWVPCFPSAPITLRLRGNPYLLDCGGEPAQPLSLTPTSARALDARLTATLTHLLHEPVHVSLTLRPVVNATWAAAESPPPYLTGLCRMTMGVIDRLGPGDVRSLRATNPYQLAPGPALFLIQRSACDPRYMPPATGPIWEGPVPAALHAFSSWPPLRLSPPAPITIGPNLLSFPSGKALIDPFYADAETWSLSNRMTFGGTITGVTIRGNAVSGDRPQPPDNGEPFRLELLRLTPGGTVQVINNSDPPSVLPGTPGTYYFDLTHVTHPLIARRGDVVGLATRGGQFAIYGNAPGATTFTFSDPSVGQDPGTRYMGTPHPGVVPLLDVTLQPRGR